MRGACNSQLVFGERLGSRVIQKRKEKLSITLYVVVAIARSCTESNAFTTILSPLVLRLISGAERGRSHRSHPVLRERPLTPAPWRPCRQSAIILTLFLFGKVFPFWDPPLSLAQ